MNIRAINSNDFDELKEIHEKFFKNEFDFPDFLTNYLCAFLVEDNGIIAAGGVRTITESVVITDMSRSIRSRKKALENILQINQYICNKFNYNELHAFIQNDEWANHLIKIGFAPTKGKSLVLNWEK